MVNIKFAITGGTQGGSHAEAIDRAIKLCEEALETLTEAENEAYDGELDLPFVLDSEEDHGFVSTRIEHERFATIESLGLGLEDLAELGAERLPL